MKLAIIVIMVFHFLAMAHPASAADIHGLWLAKKRDVAIRIQPCAGSEDEICGHIAWLSAEATQENQGFCGSKVLWGARQEGKDDAQYSGGTIYRPDDDRQYKAHLSLKDRDTLSLRAYIGVKMLGKTKIFTRTDTDSHPVCTPATPVKDDTH